MRLVFALFAIFLLFHWLAATLGSDRGQAGIIVGAVVVAATLAAERVLFGQPILIAARTLGLGRPRAMGLIAAAGISVLLLLVVPVFARVTGTSAAFLPGSLGLLPGLFAQAGIAEETLFRGFLFGRLRRGRTFARAAMLATLPFVAVHVILFFTIPWPFALAAVLLAVLLSFPLAALFELGGATIWAPALVHFIIQGTVKLIAFSNDSGSTFPLVWMAASALIPFSILFEPGVRRQLRVTVL